MFKLVEKYPLNESKTIYRATIEAPMIAAKAQKSPCTAPSDML